MNPPRRTLSLPILLALVLAVTAQLVTGAWLWIAPGAVLLRVHIGVGAAAAVLVALEWAWLVSTPGGRLRLAGFFGRGTGPAGPIDGAFLVVVTAAVVLGLLLAGALRAGLALPFSALLWAHRALAIAAALLYLLHAARGPRRRRTGA